MTINIRSPIAWIVLAACLPACGNGTERSAAPGTSGDPAGSGPATPTVTATASRNYTTNFAGTEDPLSEGVAWAHAGLYWTKVMKSNGVAYGTQRGTKAQPRPNLYDDSYAHLRGFPATQEVSVVLHRAWWINASCSHEFEILLRWSDDHNNARGYECNLAFDGSYQGIVRWNGPYGDFTDLGGGSYPGLKDGDRFEASMIGNTITTSVNGTKIAQVTDNTYTAGDPGLGFFRGNCGSNTDVGISRFAATGSGGPLDATVGTLLPTRR